MLKSKEAKINETKRMAICPLRRGGEPFFGVAATAATGLIHLIRFIIVGCLQPLYILSVVLLHGFVESFGEIL